MLTVALADVSNTISKIVLLALFDFENNLRVNPQKLLEEVVMTKRLTVALCSFCLLMTSVVSSQAHEFIVVPEKWNSYSQDQQLPFSVISSHVFMKSEELENPANVKVDYMGQDIKLTANEPFHSYSGTVKLENDGAALIHGHRLGEVWSKTVQGVLKGDKSSLQGVIWSKKYEKFCKTIVPVAGKTKGWDTKTGDTLEIMPLTNPLTLKRGDNLEVQVLYKGQPVSVETITATYDGFTDNANSYAYSTEPYGEGKAKVKISESGLWMVRVQYVAEEKGDNYDQHVMRAVLVFPVD